MACFDVWDIGACGCAVPGYTCYVASGVICPIPKVNLVFSWNAGGPYVMTYNNSLPAIWATANFSLGGYTCSAALSCGSGYIMLQILVAGPGGGSWYAPSHNYASYTCSPFHLMGSVSSGCYQYPGPGCPTLVALGISSVYVDV